MIFKIDENLGWDEKENDYVGKPSSVNFNIINHNKKISLLFFTITDGDIVKKETDCFYCDCCKEISKKIILRIKDYIFYYNKRYNMFINKIIINDKFYNKKRIRYDF